jgi:hypothetical protein
MSMGSGRTGEIMVLCQIFVLTAGQLAGVGIPAVTRAEGRCPYREIGQRSENHRMVTPIKYTDAEGRCVTRRSDTFTLRHDTCRAQHRDVPTGKRSSSKPFEGVWSWTSQRSAFNLTLKQSGTHITGRHSAVAQNGNRIDDDSDPRDKPSISGTVKGNRATVQFASSYTEGAGGDAELTLEHNRLHWRILKSHGQHYFPDTAILSRGK